MTVAVRSIVASGQDTASVLAEVAHAAAGARADFVFAFYGCDHDDRQLSGWLRERFPGAAVVGGTSCSGVMSERGLGGRDSIGLLAVDDPDGAYGSAAAPLGEDPAAAAEDALRHALEDADSAGELIWI